MSNRALFESWRGRYNDSPRVLSEALGRADSLLTRTWVGSGTSSFPSDVDVVQRHSPKYFAKIETCRLLISNDIITRHLVKGRDTFYVQTWHGSPIKAIGLDEKDPKYKHGKRHLRKVLRDVAKWDLLLSPSTAYTRIFRQAFGYEGEVLESGYPRNDILANDDGTRRTEVRSALGIRAGDVAVLYAPTWRDDAAQEGGGFFQPELIDWDVIQKIVPANTVFLNRFHQHVRSTTDFDHHDGIVDVSSYGDINDLILASDVLVSDYSSVIYDYAVYGRPIILHAPDLEHYESRVRGFYFDYRSWAPGPITDSTQALGELISDVGAVKHSFEPKLETFRADYCTYDDGKASERVLATLNDRGII